MKKIFNEMKGNKCLLLFSMFVEIEEKKRQKKFKHEIIKFFSIIINNTNLVQRRLKMRKMKNKNKRK